MERTGFDLTPASPKKEAVEEENKEKPRWLLTKPKELLQKHKMAAPEKARVGKKESKAASSNEPQED